MLFLLL
ncbi:hypothetical protein OIU76_001898, partial [Salix suchowensis]